MVRPRETLRLPPKLNWQRVLLSHVFSRLTPLAHSLARSLSYRLVTAAEMGHHLARSRVFTVLNHDCEVLDAGQAESERRMDEAEKWINSSDKERVRAVNIEKRYSIGGGSNNPYVLARRMSIIAESRGDISVPRDKVGEEERKEG
jgi:hypothetical protein